MSLRILMLTLLLTSFGLSCSNQPETSDTPVYGYRIVKTYPHRSEAFTQGLAFTADGTLYESTGLRGYSTISRIDCESGQGKILLRLPNHLFGEGITILNNKVYQLTWQKGIGFVYDLSTFNLLQKWTYDTEGWGLTHDGTHLIMSDGTAQLHWLDPNSLETIKSLTITDQDQPVPRLNELEYINGRIYANLFETERVAIIEPDTGHIEAYLDLTGLRARHPYGDVLNGIAYDPISKTLLVTGKCWSEMYAIEMVTSKPN